jgi:hypothetical protein
MLSLVAVAASAIASPARIGARAVSRPSSVGLILLGYIPARDDRFEVLATRRASMRLTARRRCTAPLLPDTSGMCHTIQECENAIDMRRTKRQFGTSVVP